MSFALPPRPPPPPHRGSRRRRDHVSRYDRRVHAAFVLALLVGNADASATPTPRDNAPGDATPRATPRDDRPRDAAPRADNAPRDNAPPDAARDNTCATWGGAGAGALLGVVVGAASAVGVMYLTGYAWSSAAHCERGCTDNPGAFFFFFAPFAAVPGAVVGGSGGFIVGAIAGSQSAP